MSDILFHRCLLYYEEELATKITCEKIVSFSKTLDNHIFTYKKMPHEIYVSNDENNGCLWLYLKSGSALPYDNKVIDIETNEAVSNPRHITQVELRNQYFALYDYNKKLLYLSNLKVIGILSTFFNTAIKDGDITIKKIVKDFNDVIKSFKSIKSIRLIAKNGLFQQTGNLFKETINEFGLGVPGQLKIDVDFSYASLNDAAIGKLKELNNKRLGGEFDTFICVGRDDTGLDGVFNMDTFTSSITVKASHDERGMYQDLEVKKELIKQLGLQNV